LIAIDCEAKEIIDWEVSGGRNTLDAYLFLKRVLKKCEESLKF